MSSLVVVAIDFGTTYSGWAFSYKDDYERDPLKITAKAVRNSAISLKGTILSSSVYMFENMKMMK
jgi:hypothetical protein